MKNVRRPRRLALVVAAAGIALTASGCTAFNPMQTHDFYQAADGTNANPEGVGVRNAILVLGDGGDGEVYLTVANETTEDATAELTGTFEGQEVFSASIPVAAGETVMVGAGDGEQIHVRDAAPKPGDIMELTVASGDSSTTISLPVMDDSLGYYPAQSDGGQATADR